MTHTMKNWDYLTPQEIKEVCPEAKDDIYMVRCEENFPVADCYEYEAAKLISAAPDLLENLIRCVDRLEENGMGDMSAVSRAKKAIKKATE